MFSPMQNHRSNNREPTELWTGFYGLNLAEWHKKIHQAYQQIIGSHVVEVIIGTDH